MLEAPYPNSLLSLYWIFIKSLGKLYWSLLPQFLTNFLLVSDGIIRKSVLEPPYANSLHGFDRILSELLWEIVL